MLLKDAIDSTKKILKYENDKEKAWKEYKRICVEHWNKNSEEMLLFLAQNGQFDRLDGYVFINLFGTSNPFNSIPKWIYSESIFSFNNAKYYLEALGIEYKNYKEGNLDMEDKKNIGIFISLTSNLPKHTKIPRIPK